MRMNKIEKLLIARNQNFAKTNYIAEHNNGGLKPWKSRSKEAMDTMSKSKE